MSRAKDILLVGLALCAGLLAIVVWRQHRELRQLAMARSHSAGAALPESTMTIRPAALRSLAVPPRRQGETAVATEHAHEGDQTLLHAPPPPARPSRRRGAGAALSRLMENPEFVEALTLQRHATLDLRFGELFRRLNLEGGELAAFKRLLAEKENVALDVVTVSETSPDGPLSPEALRASIRMAQAQIEQAIHSSLGSARYAVYRDYEHTVAQRATVAQLEQRLSYTRTPLTPAQSEAVVRILASNTPPGAPEEPPPAASVLVRAGVPEAVPILPTSTSTGRVTEEVVTQAQTVLSAEQLDALKEIQLEQQAAMKAAQMIRDVAPAATEVLPTWPTLLMH